MSSLMVTVSRQQLEYWISMCREGKAENVATMIEYRIEDYDKQHTDRRHEDNGVRPAVSEDGAYRFNPMTGCHE